MDRETSPLAPGAARVAANAVHGTTDAESVLIDGSFQLTSLELAATVSDLLAVREQTDRALVFLLADALQRGDVSSSDAACASQWLASMNVHFDPGDAAVLLAVAVAIHKPDNAQLWVPCGLVR